MLWNEWCELLDVRSLMWVHWCNLLTNKVINVKGHTAEIEADHDWQGVLQSLLWSNQHPIQLIHPKNRINTQEKFVAEPIIIIQNAILPSISHNKLPLADRSKSHSAKKIQSKQELERKKNTKSNKRLFNEPTPRSQKVDFENLIVKKQGNEGILSKQELIRTKVFSLKTPSRQG